MESHSEVFITVCWDAVGYDFTDISQSDFRYDVLSRDVASTFADLNTAAY